MNITNFPFIDDIIYKHLHKLYLNDVFKQMKTIRLQKIKNYHRNHNSVTDGSNFQYEQFNSICFNYYIKNNCRISLNTIEKLLIEFELELDEEFDDEIEIIDVYNMFNLNSNEFSNFFSKKYDCYVF